MPATVPLVAAHAAQVLTVALGALWVSGVIGRVEARLQGRRGTRVLQPYYDLSELFAKESLAPDGASWLFLATPFIAFTAYLSVPLLIPVLTYYPLPLSYMGDILGGGLILALGRFFTATAGAETSCSPYAQIGASRAKTFSALAEPTLLLVFVAVAAITATDLPYALAKSVAAHFEVHAFPRRHVLDLRALDSAERDDAGWLYADIAARLDRLFDRPMPYVAAWHQAPLRRERELAHLHLQIFSPRRSREKLKYLAAGVWVNDVAPERAAAMLRAAAGPA